MSLKINLLRKKIKLKKKDFAEKMHVSERTITNWTKSDGTIPPLSTMKDIAKILGTSTYGIFAAFIYGPDIVEDNEGFRFRDHSEFLENFRFPKKPLQPFQLFKFIKEFRLTGEGFFIYQYKLFRYSNLYIRDIKPMDGDIDKWIKYMYKPSDGFSVEDKNANIFVVTKDSILEWRVLSHEDQLHTVFEITTDTPFFPEMTDEISRNGKCILYLDAYRDNMESFLPYHKLSSLEIIENTENVIGTVIRKCRERKGLTLDKLSYELRKYYSDSFSSKTISRWETGTLTPSAESLASLFQYFDLSAEKVLDAYEDGYYVNNIIEPFNQCFDMGLNHLFANTNDFTSFIIFIRNYIFFNLSKYSESIVLGHISSDLIEDNITELLVEEDQIVIDLKECGSLLLNNDNLSNIAPISWHMNTGYEFRAEAIINEETVEITIYLMFNFPKPKNLD